MDAPGQTTTTCWPAAVRATSSAAWIVVNDRLAGLDPAGGFTCSRLLSWSRLSTCRVMPFVEVSPPSVLIDSEYAPAAAAAGAVNVIERSFHAVVVRFTDAKPGRVATSWPAPFVAPNPSPVRTRVLVPAATVSVLRTYGRLIRKICGLSTGGLQSTGLTWVLPGTVPTAATWVGAVSLTV